VEPHSRFRRERDDLHAVVPIGVHEAVLGARIELEALDGPARLRIPPGTQTGQRFRVSDRGVPKTVGGRGDLIIEVKVVLPTVADEDSKQLIRELGKLYGDIRTAER
jgi:molecular chaperone DnaJ